MIGRIVPFYKNLLNMQVSVFVFFFIPICSRLVFTIFIRSSAQIKYNSARFLIVRTKEYLFMCNGGNKPVSLALPQTSVRLLLAKWKGNALVMDVRELVICWNQTTTFALKYLVVLLDNNFLQNFWTHLHLF